MKGEDLYIEEKLKEVIKNSYSPYSKFKVSSAVETEEGDVFTGVNIENASYGLTVCAERVALFKAVSEGKRSIKRLYIYTPTDSPTPPCGACLQVLSEFCEDDMEIVIIWNKGKIVKKFSDLIKWRFKL